MDFDACTICVRLLTHPQCRFWARPGWHVRTEPRCRSRTAAPGPMFQVWCNHCLGPPALPCTGSCFWTSPRRRTWLTSAAQKHTNIQAHTSMNLFTNLKKNVCMYIVYIVCRCANVNSLQIPEVDWSTAENNYFHNWLIFWVIFKQQC